MNDVGALLEGPGEQCISSRSLSRRAFDTRLKGKRESFCSGRSARKLISLDCGRRESSFSSRSGDCRVVGRMSDLGGAS